MKRRSQKRKRTSRKAKRTPQPDKRRTGQVTLPPSNETIDGPSSAKKKRSWPLQSSRVSPFRKKKRSIRMEMALPRKTSRKRRSKTVGLRAI